MDWQIESINFNYLNVETFDDGVRNEQLNSIEVNLDVYLCGFPIKDKVIIYTSEQIPFEELNKVIDECLAKRKCDGKYDSFLNCKIVGKEIIRDYEYLKVKMDEEQFKDFYNMHKKKILDGDISIKFVCSEGKSYKILDGVRKKEDDSYQILTPQGYDPTPFPEYAYPIDTIAYFFIRYRG